MGIDPGQLRKYVVEPALMRLDPHIPYSEAAVRLVLGTGMVESELKWLDQRDVADRPGPAFGPWQFERASFNDHLSRAGAALEPGLFGYMSRIPSVDDLHWNLLLGAAMCRLLYWHAPERIPERYDAVGMAMLWKQRYNTPLGAGTWQKALPYFEKACHA